MEGGGLRWSCGVIRLLRPVTESFNGTLKNIPSPFTHYLKQIADKEL
jgi:hypothetical protein